MCEPFKMPPTGRHEIDGWISGEPKPRAYNRTVRNFEVVLIILCSLAIIGGVVAGILTAAR